MGRLALQANIDPGFTLAKIECTRRSICISHTRAERGERQRDGSRRHIRDSAMKAANASGCSEPSSHHLSATGML